MWGVGELIFHGRHLQGCWYLDNPQWLFHLSHGFSTPSTVSRTVVYQQISSLNTSDPLMVIPTVSPLQFLLTLFFWISQSLFSKTFHIKCIWPNSRPRSNRPFGRDVTPLLNSHCWRRLFPKLLTQWCWFLTCPSFWFYATVHQLPSPPAHQSQDSKRDQYMSSSV